MANQTCRCGCGEAVKGQWVKGHNFRAPHPRGVRVPYVPGDEDEVPDGTCACGCGGRTKIATMTNRKRGQFAGYPMRFIHGHAHRGKRGAEHPVWKGGRHRDGQGYIWLRKPDHPDAGSKGYVAEHRWVAEQRLGRPLSTSEHVHHINGVKDDNRPENLIVLTQLEHNRIHARGRAYDSAEMSARGKKGAEARWGKKP